MSLSKPCRRDPATGRFLTRDAKPNNTNPYVPWDPTGAIIGPLAAMALFFGRKRKRSKWDILIIIVLLGLTTGIGVIACAPAPTTPAPGSNTHPPIPVATQTPVPAGAGTSASNTTSTPAPPVTLALPDCPTPTNTSLPTSTPPVPTPIGDEPERVYQNLMDPRYAGYWWRQMDNGVKMILALIGYIELRSISFNKDAIDVATEALARRYWYACPDGCQIINGNISGGLRWLIMFSQSLRSNTVPGISIDLEQSSIDTSFAKIMADDITKPKYENWKVQDFDRPWGWFNAQNTREYNYFKSRFGLYPKKWRVG